MMAGFEIHNLTFDHHQQLPVFMALCDDEIWAVRRACTEVMPIMALLCTLEKRRKVLVPAMKKFMFDPSQWVIMSALKVTCHGIRILDFTYLRKC